MAEIADDVAELALGLSAATCLHVGRIRADAPWRLEAQSHGLHELLIFYTGRHRVVTGGEEIICAPGDALLYPPQCVHAEETLETPTEWAYFAFQWPRVIHDAPLLLHDATGRARVLADWLCAELGQHALSPDPVQDMLLRALVLQLFASSRAKEDDLVLKTWDFFQEHLAESVDLDAVARHAHRSKFHFARLYRKCTGRTPMADLRAARLNHAREMLLTTDLPLKAIAPRCGLGDEHALSRLFQKQFGMPPSAFRARRPSTRLSPSGIKALR